MFLPKKRHHHHHHHHHHNHNHNHQHHHQNRPGFVLLSSLKHSCWPSWLSGATARRSPPFPWRRIRPSAGRPRRGIKTHAAPWVFMAGTPPLNLDYFHGVVDRGSLYVESGRSGEYREFIYIESIGDVSKGKGWDLKLFFLYGFGTLKRSMLQ